MGALALSGAACGSSSTATTATTASSSGSGPTTSVAVANDVAGKRYCEVLLLRLTSAGLAADVYASYPLNTCPQDQFAALDAKSLASANGAVFALLNGPRFWVMNKIAKTRTGSTVTKTFGGIDMNLDGTVVLGTSIAAAMAPYTPKTVSREASFTYNKGTQIYELKDPSGQTWLMQSWGLIKDATLTAADLEAHPARRLELWGPDAEGPPDRGHDAPPGPSAPGQPAQQLLAGDQRLSRRSTLCP